MFCPDCGLKNRPGAKFCANCRYSFKGASPGSIPSSGPKKPPPDKKPKKPAHVKKATAPPPLTPPLPKSPQTDPSRGLLANDTILDRRYRVVRHIATGGMGAIYEGHDERLNTVVAIKEMLDFFSDPEEKKYAATRFREEALLLADLRHPNVPRVTDNFIENGRYYLIMDFVKGKSTEKLILEKGSGLPQDKIIEWAVQICDVLNTLHTKNPPIIYRDMKPSNIMITDEGNVMLVDFGIARHFSPRRPGTMIGTQGYAPPEQYKGRTEPRSDLYALAATLHHLLTGNDPTTGIPFQFKPIRQINSGLNPDLEKILEKALQNRVEMRYADAAEMKRDFEKLEKKTPLIQSKAPAPSSPHSNFTAEAKNRFLKAKSLAESGRFTRSRKELERALSLSPDFSEAHCLMGYILNRQGRPNDALLHLRRAVELDPKSATAYLNLGKTCESLGLADESQRAYQMAGRLNPSILKDSGESFLEKLIRAILS